ncbi:hypothetical protein [Streptomyces sp. NPDC050564]|uniref:hypothetical protein n=1 Tax=Streptomyces sp. NPDC050564 TaxID=3365631 RepID=UPI00379D9B01
MGRKFRDMETAEQKFARESAQRPHRPASREGGVPRGEWRSMDVHEQAAYLARQLGDEESARQHERERAERIDPPAKKKGGWFW